MGERGPDVRRGGGGGGARERHRNDFFPITFIVHNQKSNGGGNGGLMFEWGMAPQSPIVTPLVSHKMSCVDI